MRDFRDMGRTHVIYPRLYPLLGQQKGGACHGSRVIRPSAPPSELPTILLQGNLDIIIQ